MPGALGLYVDVLYDRGPGAEVRTAPEAYGFLRFARRVAGERELVLFGRAAAEPGAADLPLDGPATHVALPGYPDLTHVGALVRALPGTARAMWRGLARVERVWVFGPHPFGLLLAGLARLRGVPVVLGVRQDTMPYFRSRLRGGRGRAALAAVAVLDRVWRLVARKLPVTVAGEELARSYGGPGPGVLAMTISLVAADEVADEPVDPDWSGEIRLLTVGRIDREKDPLLLVEALAQLDGRHRMTWVGSGPLEDDLRRHAQDRGVADRLELAGFVPFGPALLERYRGAHAFVHVARTEGSPQVLFEAMACGLPIVATAVGGVPAAVDAGKAALLVAPGDAAALAAAIRSLHQRPSERRARSAAGLRIARERTLERESGRVARWLADQQVPRAVQGSSARR